MLDASHAAHTAKRANRHPRQTYALAWRNDASEDTATPATSVQALEANGRQPVYAAPKPTNETKPRVKPPVSAPRAKAKTNSGATSSGRLRAS